MGFYKGNGRFQINREGNMDTVLGHKVGMIAGGSGITPMLQIAREILKNPADETQINLIFANQTPDDILCDDIITEMSKDARFNVWYPVDRASDSGWEYSVGYVD